MSNRPRARDLGFTVGRFRPGAFNAITDVGGVQVGHCTLNEDIVMPSGKTRCLRTGITAILPNGGNIFFDRLLGSGFVLNGAGEVAGLTQVMEWGLIETPILLTNTLAVGKVAHSTVKHMVKSHPSIGREHEVIIPVVGECDDSWLNDIQGHDIKTAHVSQAIDSARSGPVAEGNVGGGTGMITCDFKGGIGTSSRLLPPENGGYTIGVLVMSNFGHMRDLKMQGLPVGALLEPKYEHAEHRRVNYGSIIAVLATDAPLMPSQLSRVAKRVALGIGRTGSHAAHGSGEIVMAFSTANRVPREARDMVVKMEFLLDRAIDPIYEASIEATEEAILNALCAGEDMTGHDGHFVPALPVDEVRQIVERYKSAFNVEGA